MDLEVIYKGPKIDLDWNMMGARKELGTKRDLEGTQNYKGTR